MHHAPPSTAPRAKLGRYALYGAIASGGMAKVHIGRLTSESGFEKTVAIKRLHPHLAEDPAFVDGLLDEARIVSRIVHPCVVPMADVVQGGEELWLVMEYVPGESLGRLIVRAAERDEKVPVRVATAIVVSVLHGLHAAHEACDERGESLGIVHRDVSPQNVLVGSDGLARLLDFGVAKARGRLSTTGAGQVKGKISYMAPEQLLAEDVDERTDIYAAGVVLWEALTSERLFRADDEGSLIGRVLDGEARPPSAMNPAVSAELDAIVMRALQRKPSDRFATAHEMAVAIEETVGVATARQVAEWMRSMVHVELDRRASLVAAVERLSDVGTPPTSGRPSRTSHDRLASAGPDAVTVSEVLSLGGDLTSSGSQVSSLSVSSGMRVVRPPSRWRTPGLIGLALSVGGLAAVALRWSPEDGGTASSPAGSPTFAAPTTGVPTAGAVVVDPSTTPTATPSVASATPNVPPPTSASTLPPKPPPVAAPKPDCNPPYTIGADGIRRLKKGCN